MNPLKSTHRILILYIKVFIFYEVIYNFIVFGIVSVILYFVCLFLIVSLSYFTHIPYILFKFRLLRGHNICRRFGQMIPVACSLAISYYTYWTFGDIKTIEHATKSLIRSYESQVLLITKQNLGNSSLPWLDFNQIFNLIWILLQTLSRWNLLQFINSVINFSCLFHSLILF